MNKPVIGAQLYTVREFCKTSADLAKSLKKVSDIGYTAVQLSGHGPMPVVEIAKLTQDAGLTVAATHEGWNRFLNETTALIEEHKLMNCRHLAIGGLPGEYFNAEGAKRFADEVGPVAEKLAEHGMDFSYHNHNHELAHYGGKPWLGLLYDQANPKHLKAEIDTYWIQAGGGDPVDWVNRCAGREPLLHCKDMVIMQGGELRMAEVGEGNLNWPGILEAAEKGGVEFLLVEQDTCYERDPFESLAISYRNLKKMGYK